jgi:hypothetical protein
MTWVTIPEAADELGCSRQWVNKLIRVHGLRTRFNPTTGKREVRWAGLVRARNGVSKS